MRAFIITLIVIQIVFLLIVYYVKSAISYEGLIFTMAVSVNVPFLYSILKRL